MKETEAKDLARRVLSLEYAFKRRFGYWPIRLYEEPKSWRGHNMRRKTLLAIRAFTVVAVFVALLLLGWAGLVEMFGPQHWFVTGLVNCAIWTTLFMLGWRRIRRCLE